MQGALLTGILLRQLPIVYRGPDRMTIANAPSWGGGEGAERLQLASAFLQFVYGEAHREATYTCGDIEGSKDSKKSM